MNQGLRHETACSLRPAVCRDRAILPLAGNVIDPLPDGISVNIDLGEWAIMFPSYQGVRMWSGD